jgi:hypothetical protein
VIVRRDANTHPETTIIKLRNVGAVKAPSRDWTKLSKDATSLTGELRCAVSILTPRSRCLKLAYLSKKLQKSN